jgi:hypothetical protein
LNTNVPTGTPSRVLSSISRSPTSEALCTPGNRVYCHNRGVVTGENVCACDDVLHYWPSEQCSTHHNGRELLPGHVCYPDTKDQYCSWLGTCNSDGSACVCDDPVHRLSEEKCKVWHAYTHRL